MDFIYELSMYIINMIQSGHHLTRDSKRVDAGDAPLDFTIVDESMALLQ